MINSFLLSLAFYTCFDSSPSKTAETELEQIFNNSDFVGFVKLVEDNYAHQRIYALEVVESFKGSTKLIGISATDIEFGDERTFLLFTKLESDMYVTHIYALIDQAKIKHELLEFLEEKPCFVKSETIEERKKKDPKISGACERIIDSVCGCNGITYGDICELRNAGIVRFKPGKCK